MLVSLILLITESCTNQYSFAQPNWYQLLRKIDLLLQNLQIQIGYHILFLHFEPIDIFDNIWSKRMLYDILLLIFLYILTLTVFKKVKKAIINLFRFFLQFIWNARFLNHTQVYRSNVLLLKLWACLPATLDLDLGEIAGKVQSFALISLMLGNRERLPKSTRTLLCHIYMT